jgi:DNA invertase Pin-like site-specific DNA recombinase
MQVVGYVRVSTERQAEEGLGMAVQEEAIREWAKRNGHSVVAVVRDEGVSGKIADRPGLADLFAILRKGKVAAVVVYRLDRLARDLVVQEQLLAEFWRLEKQVCSTMDAESEYLSDDPNDPSRRLIRQVLGAISDYERETIILRLRSGRQRKAADGGYAHGAPAFGFKAEDRALQVDEDEEAIMHRIVELRRAGLSLRAISAALAEDGLKPKRAETWHPETLARICARAAVATTEGEVA